MAEKAASNEKKSNGFFSYKGYPLVRKDNELYYGNMGDDFVVWIQILEASEQNGISTATKVLLYKMATDESLSIMDRIVKTAEKSSLYSALDIAYAWLTV